MNEEVKPEAVAAAPPLHLKLADEERMRREGMTWAELKGILTEELGEIAATDTLANTLHARAERPEA